MTNKTTVAVTIAASIFASALVPTVTFASQSSDLRMIPVIVNGQKVKFPDTEPYIDGNGRTMVPVRFVSEKLGANVDWNNTDSSVTIKYGSKVIKLPLGSNVVTVDGKEVTLDTTAVLTEGRTMVPLRFVSEALSSKVIWDESAHAVQVSDSAYQEKVANGEVVLDPWGRELSKTWDTNWNKLTDLPDYAYDVPITRAEIYNGGNNSKRWLSKVENMTETKINIDRWANHIKEYYAAMLNMDYRTVNEDAFIKATIGNMSFGSSYFRSESEIAIRKYISFAKTNHIVAKGYADPETYLIRSYDGLPIMRTHFKFMVIQADDTTQTYADNYAPSEYAESPNLDLGVWYDGYADVKLYTNSGNQQEKYLSMMRIENMFNKGLYIYKKAD